MKRPRDWPCRANETLTTHVTSTGDLAVVRKSCMGETRKAPPSQKYTAWPQERCSGAGEGWKLPLWTGGVLWAQAETCPSSIRAVKMRGGGLDSPLQARIPISRKGAGAMVPRCHVGREFVRRKDQRTQFQGLAPEGKINMPRAWSRAGGGKGEKERGGCPGWD